MNIRKVRMVYVKGDVTEPQRLYDNEISVIPHCCNDIGVMGAGVALSIKQKFPECVKIYFFHKDSKCGLKGRLEETLFGVSKNKNIIVANMIAQSGIVGPDNPKSVNYLFHQNMVEILPTDVKYEEITDFASSFIQQVCESLKRPFDDN